MYKFFVRTNFNRRNEINVLSGAVLSCANLDAKDVDGTSDRYVSTIRIGVPIWLNTKAYRKIVTGQNDAEQRDRRESNYQVEFEPNLQLRLSICYSSELRIIHAIAH